MKKSSRKARGIIVHKLALLRAVRVTGYSEVKASCGLELALETRPNEIVPYKIFPQAVDSLKELVEAHLRDITIELFRPQGKMRNFYPTINAALSSGTPDEKGIRQVSLLETDETRRRDRMVMIEKIHDTSRAKEKNSPFPLGCLPGSLPARSGGWPKNPAKK